MYKSSPESSSSRCLTDETVMKIPKGKKGPKSNLVSVQTSIIRGEEYQDPPSAITASGPGEGPVGLTQPVVLRPRAVDL